MTIREKQLTFWKALKDSDKDKILFNGTPGERQFYDIVDNSILPLKLRLDIYLRKNDYTGKGYLTICIMLSDDKANALRRSFRNIENYNAKNKDNRLYIIKNAKTPCVIDEEVNPAAIQWFTDNVKKIKEILK